ncbi:MAG TPA: acyltransferase [Acetobacteraceae bacterium]|jgi:peptidoglycan/LPS O-acetylase OafA/YrhL|nr:acyltransferase [Acetobacteraceae bacterium]
MKRLECLDGLRGVLAVYVMLGHMAPFAMLPDPLIHLLSHGGAAVDVFFILSGMVIVQSLESFGWHASGFLIARIARTYPVYLVMLAIAVPVQALPTDLARLPWVAADSVARDIWSVGWPHAWAIELATHLTMTHGLLPDAVVPGGWISFLGSAWSLSTEWQFYLLALWLGMLAGPRRMTPAFLLLAVAGLMWQQAAPPGLLFSRAFLPHKAQFFALGMASAGLLRGETMRRYAIVLLLTLAICAAEQRVEKLLPPLLWTLCLAAQLRPDLAVLRPLALLLRARWLLWLGALSYCIYLTNEPVQKLLGLLLAAGVGGNGVLFTAIWLPGAVLLPVLLSIVLHRWVETPALRRGRRYARDLAGATRPKAQPQPVVIR